MPAVVAIDVPADAPAELVSAALRSCNTALGDGKCELANTEDATEPEFYAVVRWGNAQLQLHIELRDRAQSGAVLDQRDVVFSEDDAARLRWASAGLVIASLAVQHERPPESAPVSDVRSAVPPEKPLPAPRLPAVAAFEPRVAFDIGVQAATALENEGPRFGPFLGVVLPLGSLPLQIMGSIAYARRSTALETSWLSGAVGLGVRLGSWKSRWAAELRSELVAEQVTLQAQDPATGETDETTRVRLGSSLGLGAVWMPTDHFGFVLGAKVGVMRPEIVLMIRDRPAGSVPAFGWSGSGAARLQW